jgi:hypothetical protein
MVIMGKRKKILIVGGYCGMLQFMKVARVCQNHNVEVALNGITKLEKFAIMFRDKLSKNGLSKLENERMKQTS